MVSSWLTPRLSSMHKLRNMSNCGTLTRNLGLNRTPFSLNLPYLGWLLTILGLVVASFPE
eukprot:8697997-Pyramimonas_sp.AAC.1